MTDPKQFKLFLSLLPEKLVPNLWLIPIAKNEKLPDVPAGESWKDPKFRLTPEQALARLEKGKNVAVVGLPGSLVIIDIDTHNVPRGTAIIPQNYRSTLIVKTRNAGLHFYYLNAGVVNSDVRVSDLSPELKARLPEFNCTCGKKLAGDAEKCPACGKDLNTLMEVRAEWRYVLAPGSFVPPKDGLGDGLYKVVARIPPLPLSQSLWPFLRPQAPQVPNRGETTIKLSGKCLSLPCIKYLFTIPLSTGRQVHAAKLIGIAWNTDGGTEEQLMELARAYDAAQAGFGKRVIHWAHWVNKKKITWDHCGEAINLYRANGMLPPCGLCPLKHGGETDA
jgi:hypothetical protein